MVSGQKFPNGLVGDSNGLIYVPSSMLGGIDVYQPQPNGDLTKIDYINLYYGIDNLSVDSNGDIFAAVFPDPLRFFKSATDPYNPDIRPASAGLRISKTSSGYEVSKAIEDGLGEVLPGSTTIVHDAKTGRLFMSGTSDVMYLYCNQLLTVIGIFSPFITVCDPNEVVG